MPEGRVIGEFLRARREWLRPEDVGIPEVDRRRVPGLRRSELAMLAGISNGYYVRLEQGRDRHQSILSADRSAHLQRAEGRSRSQIGSASRPPKRLAHSVSSQVSIQGRFACASE